MHMHLLALSVLVLCSCRKETAAAEDWTTYNPPPSELPADPRATEPALDASVAATETVEPTDLDRPGEVDALPDTPVAPFTPEDLQFIQQATYSGLFEVMASQLALEKSTSEPHLRFAQRMIEEHGGTNRELADLVRIKGIEVPNSLDPTHQRRFDTLTNTEPAQFDAAFVDAQIETHDAAIRSFEAAARSVDDPELIAFVQRVLPALKEHRLELDDLRQVP